MSKYWKLSQEPQRYGDRREGAEFWPLSTLHTNVRPVPQLQYKNKERPLQKKRKKRDSVPPIHQFCIHSIRSTPYTNENPLAWGYRHVMCLGSLGLVFQLLPDTPGHVDSGSVSKACLFYSFTGNQREQCCNTYSSRL